MHNACRNIRAGVKTHCVYQVSVQSNRRMHMPQESWGAQSPQESPNEEESYVSSPEAGSGDELEVPETSAPAIPAAAKRSTAKRSSAKRSSAKRSSAKRSTSKRSTAKR